jgi:DNA-binding MarR family transcriptional regulator
MNTSEEHSVSGSLLENLAEFRYELRKFLHFSEGIAIEAGLQPQQHQLLLQVAGAPAGTVVHIAYIAERLGVRHNSAVELVDRCVAEGLLAREADPSDKRRAILTLKRKGHNILNRLSADHAEELNNAAPRLTRALLQVQKHNRVAQKLETQ